MRCWGRATPAQRSHGSAGRSSSGGESLWRTSVTRTIAAADVTRLLGRRASAEEDLFEGRLQLGHHEDLVADLLAAVEAEPHRPRRRRQLMLALYRSGQQAEALDAYQIWRAKLGERGTEPSADLMNLYDAIAVDRPELQWSPPVTPGAAPT